MTVSLVIGEKQTVTDRITMFTLHDPSGAALPTYHTGAHLDFDLGDLGLRSYSLVDFEPPSDAPICYRIAVQREEDGQGGSRHMHGLDVGASLKASAPKNDFRLMNGPGLLIAGGIGVTPILSFASTLAHRGVDYAIHYTTRSASMAGFTDQLKAQHGDKLHLWHDDGAAIDLAAIIQAADPTTHLYVCGPKGMIEAVKTIASDAGFAKDHVHFELFASAAQQGGDAAFEVEVKSTGAVVTVPADKTIVEALEEAGIDLVYDCQRGDCGICQTDVLDGIPDHRDVVLSESEKAAGNVMQICVSRAKSARLVLDL